ncbi:MAG: ribosome silencing factor [Candidatus Marinarcus sp.]|uniref:ribosome silencing factor n=1 Tax=Candidatus Marinarcus sp. TaxID=3100987 RepID=UPI003AFFB720
MKKTIDKILKVLDEKKAENIEVLDLKEKDYMVDYVVVATTLNARHGASLLNFLKDELKPAGEQFIRVDEDEDWTVIDLGDTLIHLMSEKYRTKYTIEEFLKEIPKKQA